MRVIAALQSHVCLLKRSRCRFSESAVARRACRIQDACRDIGLQARVAGLVRIRRCKMSYGRELGRCRLGARSF